MISIIMLSYNREKLVSRAIESVLAQTFRDFEFIIVNNGSSDKSGAIAEEYSKKDNRVKVIHRERGNIGSGRNAGLSVTKGEYVAFIDDDDWCEPGFLEFLHNLAKENNADVAICGAADKIYDEKRIMAAEEALIELMWRKRYNMAFPTKLFKKNLADKIRFSESDKYDDIFQMYRLLAFSKKVAYHGLPKYTFYRHETNNSAWTTNHNLLNAETLDEYLSAYRERTAWLSGLFPNSAGAWRYFEWSFMISMIEKINRLGITDCDKQLGAMVGVLRDNKDEFLGGGFILEFEREWMGLYIS
ncbi:MAG: glycosyltransferase [Oscillospiraceae bacterium]|nr:glycosyltransferase [Oscillospiraceae bacterium]